MKAFKYVITGHLGIHVRPAGMLVHAVKMLDSVITIEKADGRAVNAADVLAVMGLGGKIWIFAHCSIFLQ